MKSLKEMFTNKRGQIFQQMASLAVGTLTLAIAIVVTFLILAQGTDQIGDIEGVTCTGNFSTVPGGGGTSTACNATHTLQNAVDDIPPWVPLIILASIGSILLGVVSLFRTKR